MPYPLAYRTRRIVFLFALLCPSATLAYIAIPLGDITLTGRTSTARTQDIVIPTHAPTARPAMRYLGARPWLAERGGGVRTAADNAAIDELALSTVAHDSSAAREGEGESHSRAAEHSSAIGAGRARHGNSGSSDTGYASNGMAAAGVWGGIAGVANRPADATGGTGGGAAGSQFASGGSSTGGSSSGGQSGSGGSGATGPSGSSTPDLTGTAGAGGTNAGTGRSGSTSTASASQNGRGLALAAATPGLTGAAGASAGQSVSSTAGNGAPSPNPEPASLLLMGGGLAAAYLGRRFVL